MTQSGVSHHIRRLEDVLGVALFERDRHGARMTLAGQELQQFAVDYIDRITEMRARIKQAEQHLSGIVTYAMPESCLFADHFANLLTTRVSQFPDIELRVRIEAPEDIHSLVADGSIDFGFVVDRKFSDVYKHDFFCKEEYVLVGKDKKLLENLTEEKLARLPFISYAGAADVFYLWRSIHFPRAKEISFQSLNICSHVDNLMGVVTMLQAGMGVTVLARQCCQSLLMKHGLSEFSSSKAKDPEHDVFIVRRNGYRYPHRVGAIVDSFLAMKS
jgi:DNA-binding transcriptional LysR family regulator